MNGYIKYMNGQIIVEWSVLLYFFFVFNVMSGGNEGKMWNVKTGGKLLGVHYSMTSGIYPSELHNQDCKENIGQLDAIIQSMSDGLFILDKNNNFSFLNQGGKDFFINPKNR